MKGLVLVIMFLFMPLLAEAEFYKCVDKDGVISLSDIPCRSSNKASQEPLHEYTEHGNNQIRNMLSDRPAMQEYLADDDSIRKMSPDDLVWKWVANAYNKRVIGYRIEWDGGKVNKPITFLAEHAIPYQGSKVLIRVRQRFQDAQGKLCDAVFEELWYVCIFELFNSQNDGEFINIYNRAIKGNVTKKEWFQLNTSLEHQAAIQTKHFFYDVWKPWAIKNGFHYQERYWRVNTPDDYQEWINLHQKNSPYIVWWRNYYDKQIVPYVKKVKRYEQEKKRYDIKKKQYDKEMQKYDQQKRGYDKKLNEYQRKMKQYKQRNSGQN